MAVELPLWLSELACQERVGVVKSNP